MTDYLNPQSVAVTTEELFRKGANVRIDRRSERRDWPEPQYVVLEVSAWGVLVERWGVNPDRHTTRYQDGVMFFPWPEITSMNAIAFTEVSQP